MSITVETVTPPTSGVFRVDLKLSANIRIPAETARRQVGIYVGNNIADLLHGGEPTLIMLERGACWRVPVILSSHSLGRIGPVGYIDVDVETGELMVNPERINDIRDNAQRLAASTAL